MTEIRAFVGHGFASDDKAIVRRFLDCFDEIGRLNSNFTWQTAELAEPVEVADKVLRILSNKNLFIGICTRKQRVVSDQDLKKAGIWRTKLQAGEQRFAWKTSDWAIQEIGLPMGRKLPIITAH